MVNGEIEMVTDAPAPGAHLENLDRIYSGWRFRTDETQAVQMDDFDNPAMIFVEKAAEIWEMVHGTEGKSCSSCHEAVETMAGVKAVYPKWIEAAGKVRSLEERINECRSERMGAEPWKYAGGDMTDMVALLASVSRGMPVNVAIDGPAEATWKRGKEIYYTRFGQLELSCANCHEENNGNMMRADHLSQGQINGFPTYRLKNTKVNAGAFPLQGLHPRHPRPHLPAGLAGVYRARTLCRLARQRAERRRAVGAQLIRSNAPQRLPAGRSPFRGRG